MATGSRVVNWFIKLLVKGLIHIIVIAICAGTIYLLYLKFGDLAYFALLAFGGIYYAIVMHIINSFVDDVLMKK